MSLKVIMYLALDISLPPPPNIIIKMSHQKKKKIKLMPFSNSKAL